MITKIRQVDSEKNGAKNFNVFPIFKTLLWEDGSLEKKFEKLLCLLGIPLQHDNILGGYYEDEHKSSILKNVRFLALKIDLWSP